MFSMVVEGEGRKKWDNSFYCQLCSSGKLRRRTGKTGSITGGAVSEAEATVLLITYNTLYLILRLRLMTFSRHSY